MPFRDGTGPSGFGPGSRGGYGPGRGLGRGGNHPYSWRCQRYPWLPRWWWADSNYQQDYPYPPQPTSKEEKEILEENLKGLKEEMKNIEKRIEELKESKKE